METAEGLIRHVHFYLFLGVDAGDMALAETARLPVASDTVVRSESTPCRTKTQGFSKVPADAPPVPNREQGLYESRYACEHSNLKSSTSIKTRTSSSSCCKPEMHFTKTHSNGGQMPIGILRRWRRSCMHPQSLSR